MTDFNTWSASALWTLLEVSAQATLCLAIILLLRRALGKQLRPDWSYALWGVLILRMLVPFSFSAPLLSYTAPSKAPQAAAPAPLISESPAITITSNPQSASLATDVVSESPAVTIVNDTPNPNETHLSADELTVKPIEATAIPPQTSEPRAFPIAAILFAIWLTGAIVLLGTVVYRHFHLTRAIERDAIPASESVSHVLRKVRDELRVTLWPIVLLTPSIATPTVIGVLRPRILLPKALAEAASRDELRLILMHELVHVRRRDLWIAWLWLTALSLHWFNPLMWWAGARMRRDREQACDLRVLAALPEHDRAAYGHTLLKSLSTMSREKKFARLAGAAAIVEDQAELEGRLTMIKAYRPTRAFQRFAGLVSIVAVTGIGFVQIWTEAQEPEKPELVKQMQEIGLALHKSTLGAQGEKFPNVDPRFGAFAPNLDVLDSRVIVDPKIRGLFSDANDVRLIYFGYAIPNLAVASAYLDFYETNDPCIATAEDIKLGKEAGGYETIYALRSGIERVLTTDINDPDATLKARAKLPILWQLPAPGASSAWVLYMDGHVARVAYPGEFPMDAEIVARIRQLLQGPSLANITDESQLVTLRDESAKSGHIVRACEAEMRRVTLRAMNGNPYKDKIDFTEIYRNLPPVASIDEANGRIQAAIQFGKKSVVKESDYQDYWWRVYHLASLLSADIPEPKTAARSYLEKAIATYPRIAYPDPSKHSKLQHLVNEEAMLIWDQEGVDDAERFVIDTWKRDRRFAYFFDAPWEARYAKERLTPDRLAKLQTAMGEKAPLIEVKILLTPGGMWYVEKPATWDEIDTYLSQIPGPYNYYVSLGYTSDEMTIKSWQEAQAHLSKAVKDRGFDHFSNIGKQPAPGKSDLKQVTVLISDGEWMYEGQKVTWQEIEKKLAAIPNPQDHFLAIGHVNGGFGLLAPLEVNMPYTQDAQALVEKLGFDHVSLIGNQPAPTNAPQAATAAVPADQAPQVDTSDPFDVAINGELRLHYAKASPEVQEFLRSTAKSFGRSGLWRPEIWDQDVDGDHATYLKKLFEDGTYGRHLCEGLAMASIVRNKDLVPGLIKVAAYHRDDQDYDCRPKWMAIAALARQGDESAVPTLVPLVDHGNLNTRMWAQAALVRITDQSFGADKQAWANWWNAAGKTPALGPDDVKPWTPPTEK